MPAYLDGEQDEKAHPDDMKTQTDEAPSGKEGDDHAPESEDDEHGDERVNSHVSVIPAEKSSQTKSDGHGDGDPVPMGKHCDGRGNDKIDDGEERLTHTIEYTTEPYHGF